MQTDSKTSAAMPDVVKELSGFLKRVVSMGQEMAFWRSKQHSKQLEKGIDDLLAIAHDASYFERPEESSREILNAFLDLQASVRKLVVAIPFEKRVNLLHRPLVPCYQQIMIIDNLSAAIICRLQRGSNVTPFPVVPKGSMLDQEARREVRNAFSEIVPSWDRGEWNLYDTV